MASVTAKRTLLHAGLAGLLTLMAPGPVKAVGGPPLVTDDPGTPGDGHWEINLAMISQHYAGGTLVSLPDADINYGWGDHLQLKADLRWSFVQQDGSGWQNGAGFANYGVKWRFLDEDDVGFDMSTYLQYAHGLSGSALTRIIAPPGGQFYLPVEIQTTTHDFEIDGEVGRNFVRQGANQWMAGIAVAHACGAELQCLGEVHMTYTERDPGAPATTETLVNLGVNLKLSDNLTMLFAAGREFGPQSGSPLHSLVYLGLQVTR